MRAMGDDDDDDDDDDVLRVLIVEFVFVLVPREMERFSRSTSQNQQTSLNQKMKEMQMRGQ